MSFAKKLIAEFPSDRMTTDFCLALEGELKKFSVRGASIEAPSGKTEVMLSFDPSRGNEDEQVIKPRWQGLVKDYSGTEIQR